MIIRLIPFKMMIQTYLESVMSKDSDKWLDAIKSEIDSMYSN